MCGVMPAPALRVAQQDAPGPSAPAAACCIACRGEAWTGRGAPGKVREKPSASVANVQKAEMEMTPCRVEAKEVRLVGVQVGRLDQRHRAVLRALPPVGQPARRARPELCSAARLRARASRVRRSQACLGPGARRHCSARLHAVRLPHRGRPASRRAAALLDKLSQAVRGR